MSSAGAGRREGPVPGPREISVPGQPEARALRRFARAEWGPLLRTVRCSLVTDKLRAIPLTLTAVCLTLAFQFVQNQAWGYQTVQNIGSVQAYEHLWVALLRTPLSLFVPALDLPVWGALAQILVVFGIAEICVGWRQTLVVAYVATLAGTMYARIGIWIGPVSPVGLPDSDKYVIDTGPSAAVVGLAVFVCWRYRARFTCALVVVADGRRGGVHQEQPGGQGACRGGAGGAGGVCAGGGVAAARGPAGQRLGAPPMTCSTLRRSADQRRS